MSESTKNLGEIVTRLKEIDHVFKFGEKMIPVIEGFVTFIGEFVPFIEEISGSIEDTRSKIPEASNQINKVTDATELAMTEVLDKIDEINLKLENVNDCIDELVEKRENTLLLVEKLQNKYKDDRETIKMTNTIIDSLDTSLTMEIIKNKIGEITANADQITMSLQVQDITAQQLAAVNHLIISVQHKLGSLLSAVDASGYERADNLKMEKLPDVHFDAKATYDPKSNQQVDVDSIIKNEKASQEEIDKLFS